MPVITEQMRTYSDDPQIDVNIQKLTEMSTLVSAMIRSTAKHSLNFEFGLVVNNFTNEDKRDAAIFLDLDLLILGAQEQKYAVYKEQIRAEWQKPYGPFTRREFVDGRIRVLESFAMRPNLFLVLTEFEEQARLNIANEVAELKAELAEL